MDHIVVGDRVLLNVGFHAALNRLRLLVRDGKLLWASETAYGEGITGLVKAAGPPAGHDPACRGAARRPDGNL